MTDHAPLTEEELVRAWHDYLSTACYHDEHERCRLECKFCASKCRCRCHA